MTTQFLELPEGKIAYDEMGSGPLVVCVPGMGDLRSGFRFLTAQLLEAGYRVVTMDVRGHGESSVRWGDFSVVGVGQDILALIRHIAAGPAVVIANSMAAGAAIWAAAEPEAEGLIRSLVLIGPAVRGEVDGWYRTLINVLFARPWGPAAWLMYYKTLYPTRKPADWLDYTTRLKQNISQQGRLEALHRMMLASKAASESRLAQVKLPALILMGTKDPDFKDPAAEAQWVTTGLNGACQMIEGAGHYPHTEMPETAGPRILGFLKTLQPEDSRATASR